MAQEKSINMSALTYLFSFFLHGILFTAYSRKLRGVFEKIRGWYHKQFISISNHKRHDFLFKVIPPARNLMPFTILICNDSMYSWKNSSGMPLSSVVTTLLIASTPSKPDTFPISLSLGKRKHCHGTRLGE